MPTKVMSVRSLADRSVLKNPGVVYVGRRCDGLPATPWGNPFKVDRDGQIRVDFKRVDRDWFFAQADTLKAAAGRDPSTVAVALYAEWVQSRTELMAQIPGLRGKTLVCWCTDWKPGQTEAKPCHAIALALLADGPAGEPGKEST